MAKYTVVKAFTDLTDKIGKDEFHIYQEKDKYPRSGRAKAERVAELSTNKNLRKEVLIKEVVEEDVTEDDPKTVEQRTETLETNEEATDPKEEDAEAIKAADAATKKVEAKKAAEVAKKEAAK